MTCRPRSARFRFWLTRAALACIGAWSVVPAGSAPALAQCTFDQPGTTNPSTLTIPLVQAYLLCDDGTFGGTPNATGLFGVPACAPPTSFHELHGSQPNGWRFKQASTSYGRVKLKRVTARPNLAGYPQTQRDLWVQLTLRGLVKAGDLSPADGTGHLSLLLRVTMQDHAGADMTLVDVPVSFDLTAVNGSVSFTGTVGDALIDLFDQPRIPDCANIEIIDVRVIDPAGAALAVPGYRMN